MKIKLPYLLTLLALFTLVSLSNCTRDNGCDYTTKYDTISFSPQIEAQVPYRGTDTLYFLTPNGDTSILVGGGKKYSYEGAITESGIPECGPSRYTYNQVYSINYLSIKNGGGFKFIQIAESLNSSHFKIIAKYEETNGITYYSFPGYTDSSEIIYGEGPFQVFYKDSCFKCTYQRKLGVIKLTNCKTNEEYNLIQ